MTIFKKHSDHFKKHSDRFEKHNKCVTKSGQMTNPTPLGWGLTRRTDSALAKNLL